MQWEVETVGEVYMAVSGAPEEVEDHVDHIARLSLKFLQEFAPQTADSITIRIGNLFNIVIYFFVAEYIYLRKLM